MKFLQDLIHNLEFAGGRRYLRMSLAFLAVALLMLAWNLRCYQNLAAPEAMDAAQLGRNIAEGKGYTTSFIRPFSMFLLARRHEAKFGPPKSGEKAAYSRIQEAHPDIANPPVYPLVLAGLMKVLSFDYQASTTRAFWSSNRQFWRYQPDFLIAIFNELLLLAVIVAAYFWARRLFDPAVARISAIIMLGTQLLWRFSTSGLSTMLLLLIFMGLVWCLTLLEQEGREPGCGWALGMALALAAGTLVGLCGLTRYAFGWLIVPVLVFIVRFTGARRPAFCLLALAAFVTVMTPWIVRNCNLSGSPFGTATYTVMADSSYFPEDRLERSLNPAIEVLLQPLQAKLFANLRQILQNDLFNAGGGWVTAFFLAGLMVGFRNPAVRRMRWFLLMSLVVLVIAQALGRTRLSEESPQISSENLLVLLVPLVVIYGVSFFQLLLDRIKADAHELRYAVTALFGGLCCLPMIFALLPPKTIPLADPPYHVPRIQRITALFQENELIMSDVPWAVAWYGRRQCIWVTLNAIPDPDDTQPQEDFLAINDSQRPINAVYLSPKTSDGRFISDWSNAGDQGWGVFFLNAALRRGTPPNFPLREMAGGFLPEHLLIADRKRW